MESFAAYSTFDFRLSFFFVLLLLQNRDDATRCRQDDVIPSRQDEGCHAKEALNPCEFVGTVLTLSLNPSGVQEEEYHQIQERPGKAC